VSNTRAEATRAAWLDTMARHRHDEHRAGGERMWSPRLDAAGADELRAIQDDKIAAVAPFLYENAPFYRRRFDRLGLAPTDLKTVDDLVAKWPVIDRNEMSEDAAAHPPYGTYTAVSDELWAARGWMMFSSSGSTGVPRIFRYTQHDREVWAWTNARALTAMDFRRGDTVFMMTGYGPHVWAWGVQQGLAKMGIPIIPGGGMTAQMRVNIVLRHKPTILLCTPSYALHLGRVMQDMGHDPAATGVRMLFVAGEPGVSVAATRARLEALWNARLFEFYGCTECSAHAGGFSCTALPRSGEGPVFAHLMEDVQVWEVVDPETRRTLPDGARGLTVCTNLNSESSPQLRFLVGDYTTLARGTCGCGWTHVRAMGSFCGRADDLINLRGIKMFPIDIEDALRAVKGVGDEFEIVLSTTDAGLDVMNVRCEHADASIAPKIAVEIQSRVEVRVDVEVLTPGTLPRTEFKARRVKDQRNKR
jgi:phenylacetate-CoA ligase